MLLIVTMLLLGFVLGFVGAGGSGFIIAILVTIFHIPVHTALGTAVSVMFFSVLSGSWSHFREGNLYLKEGLIVGLFGGIGAFFGTRLTVFIDPNVLMFFTMTVLVISAVLLWLKTRVNIRVEEERTNPAVLGYSLIGLGNGLISGTFGIGAAPFIQLSLIKWLHFPMRFAAGTTMLVIVPISMFASAGYIVNGYFDTLLFLKVALGTIVGTYIGAKLTKKLPQVLLRYGMVITPIASAIILLINFL
ncbi:hypothetical protein CVD25_12085 [Bacillus canaveralius]|uniref:Probable membrane transporter protein n=1 Tax=Bacillus canaveralius TaxID=1403243 RepID=A0A2N5GNB7_9BACI|nr:sulfite exporter TauE/SafE family protein [Bacillus canaveralius]PLR83770.1 hypothetical protein CU635_08505 [Bacillus canaveralius]PLR96456.1 hypothetical protein CVD25_12085 [Bacillus canaveralius]